MQLSRSTYHQIQQFITPGDIIAFGGSSIFSRIVKYATRSTVTHVAMVLDVQHRHHGHRATVHNIIEAARVNGRAEVMVNRLCNRVEAYPGEVWWLPLNRAAKNKLTVNQSSWYRFLHQQLAKPYDIRQALRSALDTPKSLERWPSLTRNTEDFRKFFCSELIAEALQRATIIPPVNASEVTPIDICRPAIFRSSKAVQLKGNSLAITGFDSLCPLTWATSI